jgi:hypothetical protein
MSNLGGVDDGTDPDLFPNFKSFGYIHHRALNSYAGLDHYEASLAQYPQWTQIAEGDVCWVQRGGEFEFYFRHPSFLFDGLSETDLKRAIRDRSIVPMESVLLVRI